MDPPIAQHHRRHTPAAADHLLGKVGSGSRVRPAAPGAPAGRESEEQATPAAYDGAGTVLDRSVEIARLFVRGSEHSIAPFHASLMEARLNRAERNPPAH